jgi:hypothetical protein
MGTDCNQPRKASPKEPFAEVELFTGFALLASPAQAIALSDLIVLCHYAHARCPFSELHDFIHL